MNDIIATGHVMRCLAIADAARDMKQDTTFILADEQGQQYIEGRGYHTIVLSTPWNDMEAEIAALCETIEREQIKSLLIDSYQVTEKYLHEISKHTKTIYLDDLNQVEGADKTIFIDYRYVPLRKAFQDVPEKKINKQVERVLLLSGGTDAYGVLEKIVALLKDEQYKEITVICGRLYTGVENLIERYKNYEDICIYSSVDDIETYMKQADIAISAGGTTLYELSACGTPTISYTIADNQFGNAEWFSDNQLIDYAGDVRYDDICEKINTLMKKYEDYELRKEHSRRMQRMIDGQGAIRILEEWKHENPVW